MQKTLNLKVKYRESFRPLAPAVLREDVAEWFDLNDDSPYMLLVADVKDNHRREMTDTEQSIYQLLHAFKSLVVGRAVLRKDRQNSTRKQDHAGSFAPD